jgi:hypothetical protein
MKREEYKTYSICGAGTQVAADRWLSMGFFFKTPGGEVKKITGSRDSLFETEEQAELDGLRLCRASIDKLTE